MASSIEVVRQVDYCSSNGLSQVAIAGIGTAFEE